MSSLRVCLIGAGEMAEIHARNIAAHAGAGLVGVVDPDNARARHVASAFGGAVMSPDAAFAPGTADAYVIASPPRSHADYLERAAAATQGYIFCEKPVDHDIDRARQVMSLLGDRRARIQMGFNRRFDPHFEALRASIRSGEIGRLEQVVIISRDPENPPLEGFQNSSGLLKETTIHDFDLARWLTGEEPAQIFVMGGAIINPDYARIGHIDTATTTIRMESGPQVTIVNSLRAAFGYDQRIEVLGTDGMVSVGNLPQSQVVLSDASGVRAGRPHRNYPQRYAEAYRIEMARFLDAAIAGAAVSPDLGDGLAASEMAEAAIRSLNEGAVIQMGGRS